MVGLSGAYRPHRAGARNRRMEPKTVAAVSVVSGHNVFESSKELK